MKGGKELKWACCIVLITKCPIRNFFAKKVLMSYNRNEDKAEKAMWLFVPPIINCMWNIAEFYGGGL